MSTATTTYRDRSSIGFMAVHTAMTFSRIEWARDAVLRGADAIASVEPSQVPEYVRHGASTIRAREYELRDMERTKSAGIAAGLRRRGGKVVAR